MGYKTISRRQIEKAVLLMLVGYSALGASSMSMAIFPKIAAPIALISAGLGIYGFYKIFTLLEFQEEGFLNGKEDKIIINPNLTKGNREP